MARSFLRWVHSLYHVVQGAHAMRCHDDEGVIVHYSRAIEISPEDLDYYYARGHAYWHKGDAHEAIADFSTVLALNPDDIHAHLARGAIYVEKGYLQQAIRDLTFVIDAGDAPALTYLLRARARAERRDFDLALADLDEALQLDPDDSAARALRSDCLRRQVEAEAKAAA